MNDEDVDACLAYLGGTTLHYTRLELLMFYDDGGAEACNERPLQLRLPNLRGVEQYLWAKQLSIVFIRSANNVASW
jgi:hypothetical protein